MSWYDVTEYVAIAHERLKEQRVRDEEQWAQTRELWVPLMNSVFKKKGGGQFTQTDLIKLSFDEKIVVEPPSLELLEKLAAKHGKRKKRKKNGK